MGQDSRQLIRIVQTVLLLSRGKLTLPWVLLIAAVGLAYLLLLPRIERATGLDLPGLEASSTGVATPDVGAEPKKRTIPPSGAPSAAESRGPSRDPNPRNQKSPEPPAQSVSDERPSDYLTEIGRETYRSPAGLVYGRGSQHGHRLKHLMAHTRDEPQRPGSHGVFDSHEAVEVLRLIDEAYSLAKSGRQTRTEREGPRTVHVVDMKRRVGYVGGEGGARRNNPTATRVQLIVEGERFVTAYPVRP